MSYLPPAKGGSSSTALKGFELSVPDSVLNPPDTWAQYSADGNVNMNHHVIQNVGAPSAGGDAVSLGYLNSHVGTMYRQEKQNTGISLSGGHSQQITHSMTFNSTGTYYVTGNITFWSQGTNPPSTNVHATVSNGATGYLINFPVSPTMTGNLPSLNIPGDNATTIILPISTVVTNCSTVHITLYIHNTSSSTSGTYNAHFVNTAVHGTGFVQL